MTVNGFEFHVYNRTDLYGRLQETFGLEPTLITPKRDDEREREERQRTLERSEISALCDIAKGPFSSLLVLEPTLKSGAR